MLGKGGRDDHGFLAAPLATCWSRLESGKVVSVDKEFGTGRQAWFTCIPSASWLQKPVAVVERTVAKKGTAVLAKAYLDYHSDEEPRRLQ
jgi:sulfate transport system substrate-binding protein